MAEMRPGQQKVAQQLFDYVAMLKVKDGLSDSEIRQRLDVRGVKPEVVEVLLKKTNQLRSVHLRGSGLKNAAIGAIVLLIGTLMMVYTLSPAIAVGLARASILAYGVIGFGVFQILHGAIQFVQGVWMWD
jgi:hypothetical protein